MKKKDLSKKNTIIIPQVPMPFSLTTGLSMSSFIFQKDEE